jgi:hypothetical protein
LIRLEEAMERAPEWQDEDLGVTLLGNLALLGVHLPAAAGLLCRQLAGNAECLGASCPLWPRPRASLGVSLPVL